MAFLAASSAIVDQKTRDIRLLGPMYRQGAWLETELPDGGGRFASKALGLAVETAGEYFKYVLQILVSPEEVEEGGAGVDVNAPYEIEDRRLGVRIRTNALTHVLARWKRSRHELHREQALWHLLDAGADANAPALYEVTNLGVVDVVHFDGDDRANLARLDTRQRPPQSLMAFQLTRAVRSFLPFRFIVELIEKGGADFQPSDPAGLFVTAVMDVVDTYDGDRLDIHKRMRDVMDLLCPTAFIQEPCRLLRMSAAPAPAGDYEYGRYILPATGELRRIVGGIDPPSGMTLLHVYVLHVTPRDGIRDYFIRRLRMLRDVYGLNPFTRTRVDGLGLTELAAGLTCHGADGMRAAVAQFMAEAWTQRHMALAAVNSMQPMPQAAMDLIGSFAGLPMDRARRIHERLKPSDDPRRRHTFG
jgi:hypothetical protein